MVIDKNKTVAGYKIWDYGYGPFEPLTPVCRNLAAEGAVLLKNEGELLPFASGEKIAVFGRTQINYYKCGTGSGGCVQTEHVPTILEALQNETDLIIDKELADIYTAWTDEHPYDVGNGWQEPWCQKEMELDDELVKAAAERNTTAVVVVGRTAGEDRDNSNDQGSFLINDEEEAMIAKVCGAFDKVVLLLNVGNIIDISFVEKYNIATVMYVWQGGTQGANAIADVLCGKVTPSGKLTDTQAFTYSDYPSAPNFNGDDENIYQEDIYVGYRYFETFAKDKVMYPFGFGLSYTKFDISYEVEVNDDSIAVEATVKNIGKYDGREVVQVYYEAPQGKLGNPARQLVAFGKTETLKPGDSETLSISFKIAEMASYDDSGVTGYPYAYVLEEGVFEIYAGTDVRSAEKVLSFGNPKTTCCEQLKQVMAPTKPFKRFVAKKNDDGSYAYDLVDVPQKEYDVTARADERKPADIAYTGDVGIKLVDVANGKNTMEEFVAQLSIVDLAAMVCGEGMSSPKNVREGTGGAIGGTNNTLQEFGIPVVCVTDGPSGLRMEGKATCIPIGTLLSSTWDVKGVEYLAELLGIEIFANDIDTILGPGLNIHRDPLNGRNFEYFSEDPLISGKFAGALTKGIGQSGASATIKHFAGNSQEKNRHTCNAVVSERALREIYLKGFEFAVKEGEAVSIMTSYNPVNGTWSSSNYDMNTIVLREEWGYKGFVMTDWWANCNWEMSAHSGSNLKSMVKAQNDIYMVCPDALTKPHDIFEGLNEGFISVGELQRNVINLLNYIIATPHFAKFVDRGCPKTVFETFDETGMKTFMMLENYKPEENFEVVIEEDETPVYFELKYICSAESLAQLQVYVMEGTNNISMFVANGTNGEDATDSCFIKLNAGKHTLRFKYDDAIDVKSIDVRK